MGTRTPQATDMAAFARDVLGLAPADGAHADFFALPDGSRFAVQATEELDPAERTVGFLVDDVAAAAAELAASGVPVGEVASSGLQRYAHFRAPDGRLYELVQDI